MTSQVLANQQSLRVPSSSVANRVRTALLATDSSLSSTVLRLVLAGVMFPHGAQKMLGWFGGYGFEGTMGFFTKTMGLPAPVGLFTICVEFFAPFLLVLGLGTRLAALGFIGLMVGAIATVHAPNGFFMNWTGQQAGEGFEYHLLVIGIAFALVIRGGGRFALDRRLAGGGSRPA
jgi:putative oxidoreductase